MNKFMMVIFLLLTLIGCGDNAGQKNSNQSKVEEPVEPKSLEHMFATLNAGGRISPSDPSVKQVKELLYRASLDYGETEQKIADMSYKASKLINEKGINVTPLEVLEAGALSHMGKETPEYADVVSTYVILRRGGQSHTEAILGLKGMFKLLASN